MRVLFALAAILMMVAPGNAGEWRSGGPEFLVGYWGATHNSCRSFHRNADDLDVFTLQTHQSCGGTGCEAGIESHRKVKSGFILKYYGNPKSWKSRFDVVERDVIVERREAKGGGDLTLIRCSERHKIMGIGLPGRTLKDVDNPDLRVGIGQKLFSSYYAVAVGKLCPKLKVDLAALKALTKQSMRLSLEHQKRNFQEHPNHIRLDPMKGFESTRRVAVNVAGIDAGEIEGFCDKVLGAFGDNGRVIPGVLSIPGRSS